MSQGGDLFAPSIFMAVPSNNIVARIGRPRFRSHSFLNRKNRIVAARHAMTATT